LIIISPLVPFSGISEEIQTNIYQKNDLIKFSTPTIESNQHNNQISIKLNEATTYLLKSGEPILPVCIKTYTFPFGTKIKEIICEPIFKINFKNILFKEVRPCTEPQFEDNLINLWCPTTKIKEIYNSLKFYPDEWFDYRVGTGILGDERVVFLSIAIYPVRYSPLLYLLQFIKEFDIQILYEEPEVQYESPNDYEMLIITPSNYTDELQPLLEHRTPKTKTKIVALEDIPSVGRDIPESIKYFIKYAIEEWGINKVMFVGGDDQLPVRMCNVLQIRPDYPTPEPFFVSDLYFADIYDENGSFCSWDSNNNNEFGEFELTSIYPDDKVDLYPDVYLCRIPCTTEEEVTIIVNKTISYENNQSYEEDWFKRIIVVGGDTFPGDYSGIVEGEDINQVIIDTMAGFYIEKIWATNNKLYSAENISNSIEQGAGFVAFDGHATASHFLTHPHENTDIWIPPEYYKLQHIESLNNKDKLPVVTIKACHPCEFIADHPCIGYAFLVNPNGGSIATVGMTSKSIIYVGELCTLGLGGQIHINWYQSFANESVYTLGEAWGKSIIMYLNLHPWKMTRYDYKIIESWAAFGDPALKIKGSFVPEPPGDQKENDLVSLEFQILDFFNIPLNKIFQK